MVGVAKSGVSGAAQSGTNRLISVGDVTALHVRAPSASEHQDARAQPVTLPNSFLRHASSLPSRLVGFASAVLRRMTNDGLRDGSSLCPGRDRRVHQRWRHYIDGERVVNRTRHTRQPHVSPLSCAPHDAELTALFDRAAWGLTTDVVHLNHGSFGVVPRVVRF
jgi:hypothetical protein